MDLNLERVGRPVLAVIRMSASDGQCRQLGHFISTLPEVLECHRVTGSDSYIMKAAVPTVHDLEVLLDRLTPFGETITSIVLSTPVAHRAVSSPAATASQALEPVRLAREMA